MKHQAFRTTTISSLLLMFAVASAYAQARSPLQAKIPFDFTVAGKTLPAGTYILERIDRRTIQETVLIRRVDGDETVMVRMMPAQPKSVQEQAKLIFSRYGERHFLSQLVTSSDDLLTLPKSRLERALEREAVESNQTKTVTRRVTVALQVSR
jgi:hypothetical protein